MRHPDGRALRTVWILGAGFSKSLGGPLLPELFRKQEKKDLAQLFAPPSYPDTRLHKAIFAATSLFQRGKDEKQWDDPEQFLDSLEAIVRSGSAAHAQQIGHLFGRAVAGNSDLSDWYQPDRLLAAARRALAADCTMFLRTADPGAERWSPYRDWVRALFKLINDNPDPTARHTIVTFNYDRVLEIIDPKGEHLNILLPGEKPAGDLVNVLKVHGSVDWKCKRTNPDGTDRLHLTEGGDMTFEKGRAEEGLLCARDEIAMATPGPGKREAGTEPLWVLAEEAIKSAEVVVFMGYRFPPGDADARRRILRAILMNTQSHLQLISVLGPDLASEESVRLRHLLTESARRNRGGGWWRPDQTSSMTFHVHQLPLYAEDYLALLGELNLFQFRWQPPANGG